jgi:hypothetical protein
MDGSLSEEDLIVPPGGERRYVSTDSPLIYETGNGDKEVCDGRAVEFRVTVGTMAGPSLSRDIRVVPRGTQKPRGRGATCSESELEVIDDAR